MPFVEKGIEIKNRLEPRALVFLIGVIEFCVGFGEVDNTFDYSDHPYGPSQQTKRNYSQN